MQKVQVGCAVLCSSLLVAGLFAPAAPVGIDLPAGAAAFVCLFAVGLAVVFAFRNTPTNLALYAWAFALRTACAVVLAASFQFDDEVGIHNAAAAGRSVAGGYSHLAIWLYHFFGSDLLVAKAFNVMVGALVVVFVGDLIDNPRGRLCAQMLALVAPPLVIYSGANLKETTTSLLVVLAAAAVVRMWQERTGAVTAAVSVVAALAVLWWLRGAAWVAMVGVALGVAVVVEAMVRRGLPVMRRVALVGAIGAGVLYLGPSMSHDITQNYVQQRAETASYFTARAFDPAAGITAYLDPRHTLSLANLAILWGRGLYVPSPFVVATNLSAGGVVGSVASLGWLVALGVGVWGAERALRLPGGTTLIVVTLGLSVATTSLVILGADPIRHRVVFIPLLLALGGMALGKVGRGWALWLVLAGAVGYNLLWALTLR